MTLKIETREEMKKLFDLSLTLLRNGKTEEAEAICDYLLIQDPSVPEYWIAGAMARMNSGKLEQACAMLQVAEAGDENNPVSILLRGLCLLRMGKEVEGLVALRRAQSSACVKPQNRWLVQEIRKRIESMSRRGIINCTDNSQEIY